MLFVFQYEIPFGLDVEIFLFSQYEEFVGDEPFLGLTEGVMWMQLVDRRAHEISE